MISTERELSDNRVIPVFGEHETNTATLIDFRGQIDRQGTVPQTWLWSRSTISRVQSLNPRLLAIDGLNPTTVTKRVLLFSPGNPLDLQPCVFVGADLPVGQYIGYIPNNENVFEAAMSRYWNDLTGGTAFDINQELITTRIFEFLKQGGPELVALFGMAHFVSKIAGQESSLLPQIALVGGMARIFLHRNGIREIASLVDYARFIVLCRLTRPLLMRTEDVEVRNAVTATKLAGINASNPNADAQRSVVALYGVHHGNGSNLWNNLNKQQHVIERTVEKAAKAIEKEASRRSTKTSRTFKRDAEKILNDFFSKTILWRFDGVTNGETIRAINRRLIREDFYDPTIKGIVSEATRNL